MDAIKTFQRFFKLEVTGELNNETIAVMKKPRCGNPAFGHLGRRQKRYKTHYRGWHTRNLRYYIEAGEDIDEATQRRIFKEAFEMWSRYTDLTFTPTDRAARANFKIRLVLKPCANALYIHCT